MEILSAEPGRCQHCGEPSPAGERFCCAGCAMVYRLLESKGLQHFYSLREQLSFSRPRPVAARAAQEEELELGSSARLYIEGIHCLGCLWLLERLPEIEPRILSSQLDLAHNILEVQLRPGLPWAEVVALIGSLGYSARPLKNEGLEEARRNDRHQQLLRLGVAAFSAGNVMLLAVSLYAGAAGTWATLFQWMSAALALPALTYSAWPLYRSAFLPLIHGRLSVDLAISLAILAGVALSFKSLLLGQGEEIYFDSLSMLVFLLLGSRYLLSRYRENLAQESPFLSFLEGEHYTLSSRSGTASASELRPGDHYLLQAGQPVPADSTLLSAESHFDFSLLNGESLPVKRLARDTVESGTRLLSGQCTLEVTRKAEESRLSQILGQIQQFQMARTPTIDFAERMGKYFVVTVLTLSALILAYLPGEEGLSRALALAIVTCPCVLAFALPLTFSRALQQAARAGMLFRNPEKIETLAGVQTIFLDKTGTLSSGEFQVLEWEDCGNGYENRSVARSLEKASTHPVARAILRFTQGMAELPVEQFIEIPGRGVQGQVTGGQWQLVRSEEEPAPGENRVVLLRGGEPKARITLGDSLRPEAAAVVQGLKAEGLRVVLLSGDAEANVRAAAERLGIPEWHSRLLPEEKAALVKQAEASAMVGDGANDAVAFQAADVGIAVQGAMDLSLRNSDLALTGGGLKSLLPALRMARQTMRLVRFNFSVTLFYNLVAGGLALTGFMSPLLAAVLMPSSALTVFALTQWRTSTGWRGNAACTKQKAIRPLAGRALPRGGL